MDRGAIARAAGAMTALILVAPACSAVASHWDLVPLTGTAAIVALAPGPGGLLVGRYDATAPTRSAVQLVEGDGRVRSVPLEQGPGYAAEAQLVSISSAGGRVIALGEARGGAHGNPRSTVWSGDLTLLREQPQTFETFGGWDAGGVAGSAYGNDGPILIGGWRAASGPGFDVAVWRPDGDRWVRADPDPALRATETRQPAAAAVTATGDHYVAVGSVTDLGAAPRVTPTAWVASAAGGPWEEVPLPRATAGRLVRATAISCVVDHCAVAGRDGAKVLVWTLTLAGQQPAVGEPILVLDHVPEDARIGVAAQAAGNPADGNPTPGNPSDGHPARDRGPTPADRPGDRVAVSVGSVASGDAHVRVFRELGDRAAPEFEAPGTLTAMTAGPNGRAYVAITHPSGAAQLWASTG